MKLILIFLSTITVSIVNSQSWCDCYFSINFDDKTCLEALSIDTVNNPENIWQIGNYRKKGSIRPVNFTKAIITDTLNPYPVNNVSTFLIRSIAAEGIIYGCRIFSGSFYVQTDSLRDYGKIEFSPNNGKTWVDIINDTVYKNVFTWFSAKPVLTGSSGKLKYFDGLFGDLGSVFGIQYGDTIFFRFSFFSDSIFDNLDGLMFDNITLHDFAEGISETRFKPVYSKIFPNPANNLFTIEFENPFSNSFELAIYTLQSKLVYKVDDIRDNRVVFNGKSFSSGTYIYKLTDLKNSKRSWGKFVINN